MGYWAPIGSWDIVQTRVSRQRQQDLNQKQYVPLPFGGGHNNKKVF